MNENQKKQFWYVIAVCTAGAAAVLAVPMIFRLFM